MPAFLIRIPVVWLVALAAVWAETSFHVAPDGAHTHPYDSWLTAATNIQAAIDAATDGDLILVAAGDYGIDQAIAVDRGVRLIGVDGPDQTAITRATVDTRLLLISHHDALVAGFTLTNGWITHTHGTAFSMTGGTVSNCVIVGNSSHRGSIIHMTGGLLTHSEIRDNVENGNYLGCGGARISGSAVVAWCIFSGNRSGSEGLGVSAIWMEGATLVHNSVFSGNRRAGATHRMITVRISGANATVRNSLIHDNAGHGIYMNAAGIVENCTITRNIAYGDTGNGVWMSAGSVRNAIVAGNGISVYTALSNDIHLGGGSVATTAAGIRMEGDGNSDDPPRFQDAVAGDFRLQPGSPGLDAGAELPGVGFDLDGTPRPIDGTGDGHAATDMGAYEAPTVDSGTLRCGFTASIYEAVGATTVTLTPHVAGIDTHIVFAGWFFGDGTAVQRADLDPVSHPFGLGLHTVSLTVSNTSGESATVVMTHDVRIAPAEVFVSPDGGHEYPFADWATAATNIQAAADVLLSTNGFVPRITVGDGTYPIREQIDLYAPVHLQSVNGPETTIITRDQGSIRILNIAHADVFVAGFTVTNGNVGHGSGIMMTGGTVSNCFIVGNQHNRASAVRMTGGRITHSRIAHNTETGNYFGCGGARLSGNAVIEWSVIEGNRPGGEGNGVMALWLSGAAIVRNSSIINNRNNGTPTQHETVFIDGADVLLRNCLIAGNPGRGVQMTAAAMIENCTITRNIVYADTGNGIMMNAGTIRNSIVWNNGIDNLKNIGRTGGVIEFSNTHPVEAGTGNLGIDPVFIDPGSDFRLDPGSPCIDAGTNAAWMAGTEDLDGAARIIGPAVDMGAYEAPDPSRGPLVCNFDADATEGLSTLDTVFTVHLVGLNTDIVHYHWNFGDGNTQSGPDLVTVSHRYTIPGLHTVSLTVTNTFQETALRIKPDYIYLAPAIAYVATHGAHIHPYDTWHKAATDIQAAVDAARVQDDDHTLVLISNGVYEINSQIDVLKGITVRSVNGPDHTVITRDPARTLRIMNIAHGAFIAGLTLTNGNQSHGSGFVISDGIVSNCVIVGNSHNRGSAVRMTGGLMTHCRILNNTETGNYFGCGGARISGNAVIEGSVFEGNQPGGEGNGVMALWMSGASIVRNSIIRNSRRNGTRQHRAVLIDSANAVLQNCLITDNPGRGLQITADAMVENCTIVHNIVEGDTGNGITMDAGAVRNSIVWDNGIDNLQNISRSGGTIEYSNTHPVEPGDGNISVAPGFIDPATDFRLDHDSPCIDAGTNSTWMIAAVDLDGRPRIIKGTHDRPLAPEQWRVDMGAYEYRPPRRGTLFLLR